MIATPTRLSLILASLLMTLGPSALARDMYRYTNELGNIVVDYRVPPEFVPGGYEVLNEKGVVVEVVPRALTPQELANRDVRERMRDEALAEEKRLREWDESLLLRYSTIEDIEAARERSLSELRIRVSILKSNRRSLKQAVENLQAQAAEQERLGNAVDAKHLRAIEDSQAEIQITEKALADREVEIELVAANYQADIDRFELLLEVVELRRTMLANENR
jgi:hypothetical protein